MMNKNTDRQINFLFLICIPIIIKDYTIIRIAIFVVLSKMILVTILYEVSRELLSLL